MIWEPKDSKLPQRLFQGEQVVAVGGSTLEKDEFLKDKKDAGKKKDSADKPEVPTDCDVLIVANPSHAFPPDVAEAIDRYMDRGGKIVVLTKTGILGGGRIADDGMASLCKKFGVELTNDAVIRFPTRLDRVDHFDVLKVLVAVPQKCNNPAAMAFMRNSFTFITPRTVRAAKTSGQFQVETILEVNEQANKTSVWAESASLFDMARAPAQFAVNLRIQRKLDERLSHDPLPVAVAVTDMQSRPRAVVFGDYTFICTDMKYRENSDIAPDQPANYEFFRSCLDWLAQRKEPMPGIPVRETQTYSVAGVNKSEVFSRLIWFPLGITGLALAAAGAGIWVVRRK